MLIAKLTDTAELRLLELRHIDELFALAQANLERLYWMPKPFARTDIESRIRGALENLAKGEGVLGGIFEKDALCGVVGLFRAVPEFKSAEIGYWIAKGHEGRGLVTKGCRAALAHAFDELKLHRVELKCHVNNARSVAVAERLGFRQEGRFKNAEGLDGAWLDCLVFGMLEDEWRARRDAK